MPLRLLLFFVIGFYACSHKNKNAELALAIVDSTFQQTKEMMLKSNEQLHRELEKRRNDQCTIDRAMEGLVFSDTVQFACDKLLKEINNVETDLKGNKTSVQDLFINQGNADKLQKSIKAYKQSLLKIDSSITEELAEAINKFPVNIVSEGVDLLDVQVQLNALSTQVYLLQNKMIQYWVLRSSGGCCLGSSNSPEIVITQNKAIVSSGGELEITAGIATYERQPQPIVVINNKTVESFSGKGVYQMKINQEPGVYDIPVKITYTDSKTGGLKTVVRKIQYSVIKKE